LTTGILLSVREKATRLPGKVLKPLGDCNVTEFLLRRLKGVRNADCVILATSIDPRDTVLADTAEREGVIAFRGSEDDKLERYRDAARAYDVDFVIVVDGDDPFVSVRHIEALIEAQLAHSPDFVVYDGLPLGATGFGVSRLGLEKVCQQKDARNTEVWGHLFTENDAFTSVAQQEKNPVFNRPDIRMTLDYPEDYAFFTAVIEGLGTDRSSADFEDVMTFLEHRPDIVAINASVAETYAAHLAASRSAG
jgi:spore coat polysaccharide biosynthesis protein SpsF